MNPSLRKAAILVSALDPAAADQLLDQMGEQQAARVRHAVMELDDVDAAEQEAILAEFFGQPAAPDNLDNGVELAISSSSLSQPAKRTGSEEPTHRFEFLHHAASGDLARGLRHEHPQLIAIVVAYLSAEKSAELLGYLPSELREEVLNRLAELDDADAEVIAELEQSLQRMFAGAKRQQRRSGPRHDHLQAILGHLRLNSPGVVAERPLRTTAGGFSSASRPLNNYVSGPAASIVRPSLGSSASRGEADSTALPTIAFEQLLSLGAEEFFAVFEEADPRVVMLALAGAPRRLFERYLAQFSTARALEFERHLEQLRPLRLRDVEAAQKQLAILAGRHRQTAESAAEKSRRFAAAA